jgi:hypothetical protein
MYQDRILAGLPAILIYLVFGFLTLSLSFDAILTNAAETSLNIVRVNDEELYKGVETGA